MSVAELRLSYVPDDEWIGELHAAVRSGGFAGEGSAWFNTEDIKEFAASLRAMPLLGETPPRIEGGFGSREKPNTVEQCHLGIVITPHGSRGALLVRVELASPSHDTPERDMQHGVIVRFLTEYAALARFADQLARAVNDPAEEAVLEGSAS